MIPHNTDAEEAVIGALLLDGQAQISPDDFYSEVNKLIAQGCTSLQEKGVHIDHITLAEELNRQGTLEKIGGAANLSHLMAICPSPFDIGYYYGIVQELSFKRKIIQVGYEITKLGEGQDAPRDTLNKADKLLLGLRSIGGQAAFTTPEERIDTQLCRYMALYEKNESMAIPTGLTDLDAELGGGLYPGDLTVVGARPGMGKTTILENIANLTSLKAPVLFATGEMRQDDLTDRDMASFTKQPITTIRGGRYTKELFDNITGPALQWLSKLKVYIFEPARDNPFTTSNLYDAADKIKQRFGLSLIVVDYIGLLRDRPQKDDVERLGYISSTLKSMAMELDVPVLAAHQLNRALEGREEKRPQLFDLRGSGNIEQDADVVLFLYRDSYYKPKSNNVTEILIAKQRQGPSRGRQIEVYFETSTQQYRDLARDS